MPTISRKPTSAGIRGSVDVVHPHLHKEAVVRAFGV